MQTHRHTRSHVEIETQIDFLVVLLLIVCVFSVFCSLFSFVLNSEFWVFLVIHHHLRESIASVRISVRSVATTALQYIIYRIYRLFLSLFFVSVVELGRSRSMGSLMSGWDSQPLDDQKRTCVSRLNSLTTFPPPPFRKLLLRKRQELDEVAVFVL
jgi:hypothetical protein